MGAPSDNSPLASALGCWPQLFHLCVCLCMFVRAGHHAEANEGAGFCIFNNIAVAAAHALQVHALTRIAIVDYDVHHGGRLGGSRSVGAGVCRL